MKILLSAYACEPHKGSEPAVGWNWMRTLAKQGHEVHVLTRTNNSGPVDAAIGEEGLGVTPVYYDLPAWCRRLKRWSGGIYFYYLAWQFGAYRRAKKLHQKQRFDRVHHITFASFRQPSFMGGIGIPFVFGPIGGGETMPGRLRRGIPWASRFREALRDFGNAMVKVDPLMHFTFSRASVIACTTKETLQRIPARFHPKCVVLPTIGVDVEERAIATRLSTGEPRFLFVGRLLYWKGLHLVLRALTEVRQRVSAVRLRVIGEGDDLPWLKKIAEECGVADIVDWIPWMAREEILREYHDNTAFVFPSLHDSGGMVVLEALAAGLPVICLNLGGPGAIVNSSCGIVIEAADADESAVRKSLTEAMIAVASESQLRERLASNCVPRARQLSWDQAVEVLYGPAEKHSASR